MKVTLHGIPNCDTVKRARAWLTAQGIEVVFCDFKKQAPTPQQLQAWFAAVGHETLLNTRGTTWRQLDAAAQAAAASEAGAIALMQAQPSVIKRPVVKWPQGVTTVGFEPAQWQSLANAAKS